MASVTTTSTLDPPSQPWISVDIQSSQYGGNNLTRIEVPRQVCREVQEAWREGSDGWTQAIDIAWVNAEGQRCRLKFEREIPPE